MPFGPVSAKVNNKVEGLHYRVYHHKDVEFLIYTRHPVRELTRVRCSLYLCKAVEELFPDGKVVIDIPVSNGYYCNLHISRPPRQWMWI